MPYVGRGGEKMAWGLEKFSLDVHGLVCCDLGSHVGGFVDALLQAGAAKVYAVDTCYGTFAWKLRNDPRVVVRERTNALHVELPEKVDMVTCDVGWTRQALVLPHAATLVRPGGMILSLLKPQYELPKAIVKGSGRISEDALPEIVSSVSESAGKVGELLGVERTPFLGGKGSNPEFFLLIKTQAVVV